ncbi:MAG TPA: single-stranded DNA-binding protein [Gemmatimonadales bacterium]|nr:single-stranded DNA-binding protein [Gemmatimonadales bacterium]
MSRSLNKVMLIGNLGADPEVRSTSNGARVATLSLATSRQWNTQAGEKQEKTEWHRCVVWNSRGSGLVDVVEKYLKKGDRVYVEGRIEYRTWQDKEGQKRYSTEINVRDLVMLSGRGDGGAGGGEMGRRASAGASKGGAAGAEPAAGAATGKEESFEDFPEALDEEDDDLPF